MRFKIIVLVSLVTLMALVGCELMNDKDQAAATAAKGSDLIINEVFTIPSDKYYAYSWIEIYNPTDQFIPWGQRSQGLTLWAAGTGSDLFRSTNNGFYWDSMTTPIPKINSLDVSDATTLFAVSDSCRIYKTTDGGESWGRIMQDSIKKKRTPNLYCVDVLDIINVQNSTVAYACGDEGTVLRTINKGRTWDSVGTRTTKNLYFIAAIPTSQKDVIVCGDSTILYSTNTGSKWEIPSSIPRREKFNCVRFPSATMARVVGDNGVILKSTNHGLTWIPEQSNVTGNLNSISFLTTGHAYAVGDNGLVVKADSMNVDSWRVLNPLVNVNFNYVEFIDSSIGILYGDNGTIIATTDGGSNWINLKEFGLVNIGQDLKTGVILPFYFLQISVPFYVLQVSAERKYIHWQIPYSPNPDFIDSVSSGTMMIDMPDDNSISRSVKFIKPGGFLIFTSDENKFNYHTYTGPSEPVKIHKDTVRYITPTPFLDSNYVRYNRETAYKYVRWNLLPKGEVRLLKGTIFKKYNSVRRIEETSGFIPLQTVDVMRYGDFTTIVDYPQNRPASGIPEWLSLARYADLVTSDLNTMSSNKYFYVAKTPIPGWVSQLRSH